MLLLFTTLEIILQCFPSEGPSLLQPALQRLLVMVLGDKESGLTISSRLGNLGVTKASWADLHVQYVVQPVCTRYIVNADKNLIFMFVVENEYQRQSCVQK